jgi:hypothetical protein
MQRLIGSELASLGRRLMAELDGLVQSAAIHTALLRLRDAEATARIRRGPDAVRVNGYL